MTAGSQLPEYVPLSVHEWIGCSALSAPGEPRGARNAATARWNGICSAKGRTSREVLGFWECTMKKHKLALVLIGLEMFAFSGSAAAGGSHGGTDVRVRVAIGSDLRPLCPIGFVDASCVAPVRKAGRFAGRAIGRTARFAGRALAHTAHAVGAVAGGVARGVGRFLFGRRDYYY
jgi:hypothetical protein